MLPSYFILSSATRRNPAPVTGGRYFIETDGTIYNLAGNVIGALVAGQFEVPDEVWPGSELVVEALGAGGYSTGEATGGGGQWARRSGFFFADPGDLFDVQVGVPDHSIGISGGTPSSPTAGDSWFSAPTDLFAQYGGNSVSVSAGEGGKWFPSPPVLGWDAYAGGKGGDKSTAGGGNGGGSAAGPHGAGQGPIGGHFPGGGAPGGANGGDPATFVAAPNGCTGGKNRHGTGEGVGGLGYFTNGFLQPVDGEDSTEGAGPGGGGGIGFIGGGGEGGTYPGAKGGKGSTDPCWDGIRRGPGSGGGGGGADNENPFHGGGGGDAGEYGGAAGGPGYPDYPGAAAAGKGLIVVSWGDMIGVYY